MTSKQFRLWGSFARMLLCLLLVLSYILGVVFTSIGSVIVLLLWRNGPNMPEAYVISLLLTGFGLIVLALSMSLEYFAFQTPTITKHQSSEKSNSNTSPLPTSTLSENSAHRTSDWCVVEN